MSISIQEYVARLRAIHQQVEVLSSSDGTLPAVSEWERMEVFARIFRAVPELEQQWNEIGMWIDIVTLLLEYYHELAGLLLEEEDTAKLPASRAPEERRRLLDYQTDALDRQMDGQR